MAYQKFSDALKSEVGTLPPPKPPKAPKVEAGDVITLDGLGALGAPTQQNALIEEVTLGGLGTLGGVDPQTHISGTTVERAAWADDHEERAAIVEHDGGAPRAWAEGFARLDPDDPPGDVPLKRWRLFVDAGGKFLDGGWAAKASELGWGPLDIFGCDRVRPFARIDHAGLIWFLHDATLVRLDRDQAVVRTFTGAEQVIRRKVLHDATHTVEAWALS